MSISAITPAVLRQMLDQLPLGVTLLEQVDEQRLQFRFCYANETIESLLQFPLGSVVGHTLSEAFPQTYIEAAQLPNALNEALKTQKRIYLNHELYKDSNLGLMMYDAYCQPLGEKYVMIALDKVDTFEDTLKNDPSLPQILLAQGEKAAMLSSWIVEPSSGHTLYTKSYLEVHHFKAEEITPHNATQKSIELIHPEDAEKMRAFRERENRNYPDSIQYRFRIPDGSYIWLEDTISSVLSDGRILGATQDVSRQISQQIAFENASKQLNKILETSPEIIYVYDLVERKNVFSNKSLFSVLGFTESEVQALGEQLFLKTIHPEDLDKVFHHHSNVLPNLQEDEIAKLEYRMFNKIANRYAWLESTESLFDRDEKGEIRSIIGVARDITREKDAVIKMQESQAELEQFVYSVSHDLRAPVRHIASYTEIISDRETNLSLDTQELLDRVLISTQRLGGMIDGLLAYSRTRKAKPKIETIDTNQLVREIVDNISATHPDRKIEWDIADLANCHADKLMLKQIWENLIENAVKYSSKKPSALIEIQSKSSKVEVTFQIKDNGAGFDPRYADKLFTVFQRLHIRSEFPGHGIGLASVKRIISVHKGEIWAEGVPDQGATFYFSLPIQNHE